MGAVWGLCGWERRPPAARLVGMTTTTSRPAAATRTRRYSTHTSNVLLVAFAGSAAYTVWIGRWPACRRPGSPPPTRSRGYSTRSGSAPRSPSAPTGSPPGGPSPCSCRSCSPSRCSCTRRRSARAADPPVGWIENDGYVALLALALYLVVQRLRRVTLRREPCPSHLSLPLERLQPAQRSCAPGGRGAASRQSLVSKEDFDSVA